MTPTPQNTPKKTHPFVYLLIVSLLLAGFSLLFGDKSLFQSSPKEVSLTQLLSAYEKKQLKTLEVEDNQILAELDDGSRIKTTKESSATVQDLGFTDRENPVEITIVDTSQKQVWGQVLFAVGPILLIVVFLIFLTRRAGSMGGESGPFSFGKSRAKMYDKTKHKTKFSDVAGAEEAKDEVEEVVDFLKNPKKYQKMGAKIPKGILLVGAPGTGKTLVAR